MAKKQKVPAEPTPLLDSAAARLAKKQRLFRAFSTPLMLFDKKSLLLKRFSSLFSRLLSSWTLLMAVSFEILNLSFCSGFSTWICWIQWKFFPKIKIPNDVSQSVGAYLQMLPLKCASSLATSPPLKNMWYLFETKTTLQVLLASKNAGSRSSSQQFCVF